MGLPKPYTREHVRRALARTIRALRHGAGVSQEQLAGDAVIDRSYMSQIERGLTSPTIEVLCKLLPALGVTCEEFGAELDKNLRQARK